MASHAVFILINFLNFFSWIRNFVSKKAIITLTKFLIVFLVFSILVGVVILTLAGKTQWSGRSLTLLDPTYAKKYIPIIASVSEHQATTWSSFFFDLHYLILFSPVGLYYCYYKPTETKIFGALYTVLGVYFASVMVRLLLVLAPAVSIMAGIGISWAFRKFAKSVRSFILPKIEKPKKYRIPPEIAIIGLVILGYYCSIYVLHANFAGSEAYASPSIILSSRDRQGNRNIIDDYREAYYWLRMNTRPDDKIMSWWDYGY